MKLSACDPPLCESLCRVVTVCVLLRVGRHHVDVILGPDHRRRLLNAVRPVFLTTRCPPVRHHDAAESELAAQDRRQKIVLGSRPGSVHGSVRRHDGGRRALAHSDLKPAQVDLPERPLRDDRIGLVPSVLLVVGTEVLDRTDDSALAHAAQLHDRHLARQEGILGEILEIPSVQRMPVDIHPGAQKRVDTVLAQFHSLPVIELLDKHVVPSAGKACAGRHGKGLGPAVHANAAGAVRTASDRDPEFQETICHASEGGRCAGRHLGRAHALSPREADQVLVGELSQKIVHLYFAVRDVAQAVSPVTRIRGLGRKSLRPSLKGRDCPQGNRLIGHRELFTAAKRLDPGEGIDRRHSLFQLLDHRCSAQREAPARLCIANAPAHMECVCPLFQYPGGFVSGHAAVIIAGDRPDGHLEPQILILTGIELYCLSVSAEHSGRFAQFPLRRLAVDLHDLLAGRLPRIHDACAEVDRVVSHALHPLSADLELCIGKAEPEWIHHLFRCKGLKIAIAHIDVFSVAVPVRISEIGR